MLQCPITLAGAVLVATTAIANAGGHGAVPAVTGSFKGETYLMDANKMTLYTFDKDEKGVSNCYDDCAAKWPPPGRRSRNGPSKGLQRY